MSPYLKSALILIPVTPLLVVLQVVVAFQAIAMSGAGGLGAVSGPLSEAIELYVILTAIVWGVIYWRSRSRRTPRPS
jgi:hypothetical protein